LHSGASLFIKTEMSGTFQSRGFEIAAPTRVKKLTPMLFPLNRLFLNDFTSRADGAGRASALDFYLAIIGE